MLGLKSWGLISSNANAGERQSFYKPPPPPLTSDQRTLLSSASPTRDAQNDTKDTRDTKVEKDNKEDNLDNDGNCTFTLGSSGSSPINQEEEKEEPMGAVWCCPQKSDDENSKVGTDDEGVASQTKLLMTKRKTDALVDDKGILEKYEQEIERYKQEAAQHEEDRLLLNKSLGDAEAKTTALEENLSNLQKEKDDLLEQVKKLTSQCEDAESIILNQDNANKDDFITNRLKEANAQNKRLTIKLADLATEKRNIEARLNREMEEKKRRKKSSLKKREMFMSKLGEISGKLKEDIDVVDAKDNAKDDSKDDSIHVKPKGGMGPLVEE